VDDQPWWRELTRYHWFVLVVAALGWIFDTMDQQLFNLARMPALTDLLHTSPGDPQVKHMAGITTMIFMIGWATGGIVFGVMGDRIGRAKTMALTILLYSLFTGWSAFSYGVWDFTTYRFLTGLGVGGEFAVGVALVAEVMPERARTPALGWLQASSALGNITAALINMLLGYLQETNVIVTAWPTMFIIGALPAFLVVFIMIRLKEPERWTALVRHGGAAAKRGSYVELFGDRRWRRNALAGLALAFAGVVGLWGIGFFAFDFVRVVFRPLLVAQGLPPEVVNGKLTFWAGVVSLMLNVGAFFGVYAFSRVAQVTGRKPAFALGFILAMLSTIFTFRFLSDFIDVFWMIPLMGFCQLSVFGGYAIYFPELFPTRLRSTGTSFCYNVGRYIAAIGPLFLGLLTSEVYQGLGDERGFRYAGITMCAVFLIGLLALPFAPETKGQPLPE
jgi:MFS family permease